MEPGDRTVSYEQGSKDILSVETRPLNEDCYLVAAAGSKVYLFDPEDGSETLLRERPSTQNGAARHISGIAWDGETLYDAYRYGPISDTLRDDVVEELYREEITALTFHEDALVYATTSRHQNSWKREKHRISRYGLRDSENDVITTRHGTVSALAAGEGGRLFDAGRYRGIHDSETGNIAADTDLGTTHALEPGIEDILYGGQYEGVRSADEDAVVLETESTQSIAIADGQLYVARSPGINGGGSYGAIYDSEEAVREDERTWDPNMFVWDMVAVPRDEFDEALDAAEL